MMPNIPRTIEVMGIIYPLKIIRNGPSPSEPYLNEYVIKTVDNSFAVRFEISSVTVTNRVEELVIMAIQKLKQKIELDHTVQIPSALNIYAHNLIYKKGDVVVHKGIAYIATQNSFNHIPIENSNHWEKIISEIARPSAAPGDYLHAYPSKPIIKFEI